MKFCDTVGELSYALARLSMFLGARFVGGVFQISDMHFQIALTFDHVADFA